MTFQDSLGLGRAAASSAAGRLRSAAAWRLAGVAVLALLFLTPITPATAHDAVEAAEPADGSVLSSVPAAVKLTFNNTPIALGAAVQVTDFNGIDQADGGVAITDNIVTQELKEGAPAGRYTVTWRVVSSDSHPIEGRFTFTAGDTSGLSPATEAAASTTTAGAGSVQPAGTPWVLVTGGLVLVGALLLTARSVRKRLRQGGGTS